MRGVWFLCRLSSQESSLQLTCLDVHDDVIAALQAAFPQPGSLESAA